MTEAEWRTTDDVTALLRHVAPAAGERRNRLYLCAVAWSARRWFYAPELCVPAIEAGERFADGEATAEECEAAAIGAFAASGYFGGPHAADVSRIYHEYGLHERLRAVRAESPPGVTAWAILTTWKCARIVGPRNGNFPLGTTFPWQMVLPHDWKGWTDRRDRRLVDCVYGDPFRPLTVDPAWQTLTTTAVARMIYDAKAFHDLPVLADALEDAGCDAAELLAHCRADSDHARGCWALDAVLGLR